MCILNKNIFILTGAGISKESGIETFREKDGLWDNYKIEDVCTVEAFNKDPDYVNNFYNERELELNLDSSDFAFQKLMNSAFADIDDCHRLVDSCHLSEAI